MYGQTTLLGKSKANPANSQILKLSGSDHTDLLATEDVSIYLKSVYSLGDKSKLS